VSLVLASLARSVAGLVATQGLLYGLSFALLYFPVLRMLDEWFVRRRGLAYALLYAGSGVSGVAYPFVLETLLARFSHVTTLRALAVAQLVLVAPVLPMLPMLRGRLPVARHVALPRTLDLSFFAQPLFYCFVASNACQGIGYYITSLCLPTFASSLGLSSTIGALAIALMNLANIIGQVGFGYISDHTQNVLLLVFISSFTASVASFLLRGSTHSVGALLAYALLYGWTAGAFVVFWPKFGSVLSDDPQPIYSMMAFTKGIGNIAVGPISSLLMTRPVSSGWADSKLWSCSWAPPCSARRWGSLGGP
jgi:MFS family permease